MTFYLKNRSFKKHMAIAAVGGVLLGWLTWAIGSEILLRTAFTLSNNLGSVIRLTIPFIILAYVSHGVGELGKDSAKLILYTLLFIYVLTLIAGVITYLVSTVSLRTYVGADLGRYPVSIEPYFSLNIPPPLENMTALALGLLWGFASKTPKLKALHTISLGFKMLMDWVIYRILLPLFPLQVGASILSLLAGGNVVPTLMAFAKLFVAIVLLQVGYSILQFVFAAKLSQTNLLHSLYHIWPHIWPAYLSGLGTQSATMALPVTSHSVDKMGVPPQVSGVVLPFSAISYMPGDIIALVATTSLVLSLSGLTMSIMDIMPFIMLLSFNLLFATGLPGGAVMAALGPLEGLLGFTLTQQTLLASLHFAQRSLGSAANIAGDGALALIMKGLYSQRAKP